MAVSFDEDEPEVKLVPQPPPPPPTVRLTPGGVFETYLHNLYIIALFPFNVKKDFQRSSCRKWQQVVDHNYI